MEYLFSILMREECDVPSIPTLVTVQLMVRGGGNEYRTCCACVCGLCKMQPPLLLALVF